MAGPIAIEAAVELPDRVIGVIPIDSMLDAGAPEDAAEDAKFFRQMRAGFAATVEQLVRSIVPKTIDPAILQRILAFELANDPEIAVPVLENNWSFPVKATFAKVKVPIIAINADQLPTNVDGNRALAPQFQVRLIKGVGHWPMLEAPQQFNALLVHAVADIAAPPAS
jgi:pimeloyl-ACP methyl ester carboxylesterase